jgi:hypothetical protein
MKIFLKILNKTSITKAATIVLLSFLFACTSNVNPGSGDVLVRVYDKYLLVSDLEGVVPPGTSVRDSLTIVRTFIQNWVDKELIVKKAEENLPEELKDFSAQIKEYRNSLVIFEYEKLLVKQELDTNISFENLTDYYNRHKNNFILKDDILNMQYLVLHTDSPAMRKFRQYIVSEVPEEKDSLALYSSKYAVSFSLLEDHWIGLDEMRELVPVDDYSYRDFTAQRKYMEVRDSVFVYMIFVSDYKPADSVPPIQFVEKDIKKIILNKRKNELIKEMRQTVLQDAIEHNQVEIY